MNNQHSGILRLIAFFKFFKTLSLLAVGVTILKLGHHASESTLEHWVRDFGLNPGGHYVDLAVSKIASIPPQRLREAGFGSFGYAALFLTEGTGLWLLKPWAEWFTTIITGSLVPLEIYEITRHPTPAKIVILAINIAVVVYLILHIRRQRAER